MSIKNAKKSKRLFCILIHHFQFWYIVKVNTMYKASLRFLHYGSFRSTTSLLKDYIERDCWNYFISHDSGIINHQKKHFFISYRIVHSPARSLSKQFQQCILVLNLTCLKNQTATTKNCKNTFTVLERTIISKNIIFATYLPILIFQGCKKKVASHGGKRSNKSSYPMVWKQKVTHLIVDCLS